MFEKTKLQRLFANRLAQLREKKGVTAKEMSIAIGKGRGYISDIEVMKQLPSMKTFFLICEYLGITPGEYFDDTNTDPVSLHKLNRYLKLLNPRQLKNILAIVMDMLHISPWR